MTGQECDQLPSLAAGGQQQIQRGTVRQQIQAETISRRAITRDLQDGRTAQAAVAVEHNCTLCSTDSDFARFPGLKWRNPLSRD